MTMSTRRILKVSASRTGLRWGLSFLCVLALHGAVTAGLFMRPPLLVPEEAQAGAMFVELALLPTAPAEAPEEISPVAAAGLAQDPPPLAETVPEPASAPESGPVVEREVGPEAKPELEPLADAPPQVPTAEAELPDAIPPVPPRRPARPQWNRPAADEKRAEDERPQAVSAARATPVAAAARTRARQAAPEGAGAKNLNARREVSAWQREVMRRLARHKRYPQLARSRRETGVARISFTMDSRGHVQSVHLIRGTGHTLLDKEALALPRRASPLPVPPKHILRRRIELVVPVRFSIK